MNLMQLAWQKEILDSSLTAELQMETQIEAQEESKAKTEPELQTQKQAEPEQAAPKVEAKAKPQAHFFNSAQELTQQSRHTEKLKEMIETAIKVYNKLRREFMTKKTTSPSAANTYRLHQYEFILSILHEQQPLREDIEYYGKDTSVLNYAFMMGNVDLIKQLQILGVQADEHTLEIALHHDDLSIIEMALIMGTPLSTKASKTLQCRNDNKITTLVENYLDIHNPQQILIALLETESSGKSEENLCKQTFTI